MKRIQSFLLCQEHEHVPPGNLQTNGVELRNVSAAYESKKPRPVAVDMMDPATKELLDTKWEAALLQSQLEEAEQKIKLLVSQQEELMIQAIKSKKLRQELLSINNNNNQDYHEDEGDDWEELPKETAEPVVFDAPPDEDSAPIATIESFPADTMSTAGLDVENKPHGSNLLCLKRVDFECNEGELIAAIGFVGSGKSTLINTILGEVRVLAGTNSVRGSLSYFSQSPFILNATIRDNILFGHVNDEEIDEARYQRALECCALQHDLKMMQHGDQTEIGERGVTLSGGQKAR